jgi:hypothetical protein
MTDEERYVTQGRARDAAKKLRVEVATLRTWFEEYSQKLLGMEHAMIHFLNDPRVKSGDGQPTVDHLNRYQRQLSEPGFFEKTCEYIDATAQLRKLEEQIKNFE